MEVLQLNWFPNCERDPQILSLHIAKKPLKKFFEHVKFLLISKKDLIQLHTNYTENVRNPKNSLENLEVEQSDSGTAIKWYRDSESIES